MSVLSTLNYYSHIWEFQAKDSNIVRLKWHGRLISASTYWVDDLGSLKWKIMLSKQEQFRKETKRKLLCSIHRIMSWHHLRINKKKFFSQHPKKTKKWRKQILKVNILDYQVVNKRPIKEQPQYVRQLGQDPVDQ